MSRITWFVAGAATGVYGIFRAKRAARNLTPDGLAARAAAVGAGVKVFASAVSTGMAEREGQLRDQLRDHAALTPGGGDDAVPPMMDTAMDTAMGTALGTALERPHGVTRAIEPAAAHRKHDPANRTEGGRVGHR